MLEYTLKAYAEGRQAPAPHGLRFYILSKGLNAGRPSKSPYCNSFEITAESEEASRKLFWAAYALWKGRECARLLKGSVIPFIRIREYKKLLAERHKGVSIANANKYTEQIELLLKGIETAEEKIKTLKKMQILLSRKLLSPKQ